jgi:hypothetical protein
MIRVRFRRNEKFDCLGIYFHDQLHILDVDTHFNLIINQNFRGKHEVFSFIIPFEV